VAESLPFIDIQILDRPVDRQPFDPLPTGVGGECVFLGRTRMDQHPRYGMLKRLSYEAYREMALKVLNDLASQSVARFGCLAVRVHHAVGEVPMGAASVLVQVACPHRDKAFEACRFLIDRLKTDAPVWKREVWERGETWSPAAHGVEAAGVPPT
jgi:molybdopterin synthase catalytic subunit